MVADLAGKAVVARRAVLPQPTRDPAVKAKNLYLSRIQLCVGNNVKPLSSDSFESGQNKTTIKILYPSVPYLALKTVNKSDVSERHAP